MKSACVVLQLLAPLIWSGCSTQVNVLGLRDMSSLLAPDDGVAVVASDKPTDFIEAGWKLVSGFRDVPDVPQWLELHGAK